MKYLLNNSSKINKKLPKILLNSIILILKNIVFMWILCILIIVYLYLIKKVFIWNLNISNLSKLLLIFFKKIYKTYNILVLSAQDITNQYRKSIYKKLADLENQLLNSPTPCVDDLDFDEVS